MSKANFLKTNKFNNFEINSLIKNLKKENKDINRYCFHPKRSKSIQIMLVYRKKGSYKILERAEGLTGVLILSGKMKFTYNTKSGIKKTKILGKGKFFTLNKNFKFENEIISNDSTMLEFCSSRPKVIKRFY